MASSQSLDVVSVDCNGFWRNGTPFRPLVANYILQIRKNYTSVSGDYFLTPAGNYSTTWSATPPTGLTPEEQSRWGGAYFIGTETECLSKLLRDFQALSAHGFNALRIIGVAPTIEQGTLTVPTGSYTTYFAKLDELLTIMTAYDLKAILLVGNGDQWGISDVYRGYLESLASHLNGNPALLAFDLYNEPAWLYPDGSGYDKYRTANWVADSYWALKKYAPDHLVTIGLSHPDTVYEWDPALMTVDFISYHFYAGDEDLVKSQDRLASLLYWAGKTTRLPWILGETGYSGTDLSVNDPRTGSQAQQQAFADFTLQRSLDCNCKGYSWWQFQDIEWGNAWDNYMGLITFTDPNLLDSEQAKLAFASFPTYAGLAPQALACTRPSAYYNLLGAQDPTLTGRVVDHSGTPVANAVITGGKRVLSSSVNIVSIQAGLSTLITTASAHGMNAGEHVVITGVSAPLGLLVNTTQNNPEWPVTDVPITTQFTIPVNTLGSTGAGGAASRVRYPVYGTFSDSNGDFTLHTDYPFPLNYLRVSYPGCTVTQTAAPAPGDTYTITPVNFREWSLRWTNNGNSRIEGWTIRGGDRFYHGDFDGDGKDELLCVQTGGNADWITILHFENGTWRRAWSNYGDPSVGHGIYPYRGNLVVGDFNGDGKDEVLGNDAPSGGWMTVFAFDNGDWQWMSSDYGHTSNPLRPYSYLVAGDFDGAGKDDLLGTDTSGSGGWMTWFRYDVSNGAWVWVDSDYGQTNQPAYPMSYMRGYRYSFTVGDFDGDGRDEVLGSDLPGGWLTVFDIGSTGRFEWLQSDYGSSSSAMYAMRPYGNQFVSGNFDSDGKDEVLGFASWATMFDFDNGNFAWGWSTYNDARLSDLNIGLVSQYFAFRVYADAPEYLMVIREVGGANYLAAMYAYKHRSACP